MERHASITPSHPGEILREEVLPALAMDKAVLANALGIPSCTLNGILDERIGISTEVARRLGELLGNGAGFWLNLQCSHDLIVGDALKARR